jgi:hypothetical protein
MQKLVGALGAGQQYDGGSAGQGIYGTQRAIRAHNARTSEKGPNSGPWGPVRLLETGFEDVARPQDQKRTGLEHWAPSE